MTTAGLSVLLTADAVGGVWTYALDLARGLSAEGCRITLAVLGPPPGVEQRAAAGAIERLAVVETGLPLDWTAAERGEVVAAGRAVADIAEAISADLVHLNSPALAACAAFRRPLVAACHSCVATWWETVRGGPLPPDLAWRAELVREGYAAAAALLAPSAAFAHQTARVYRLATPPAVVLNGRRAPRPDAAGRGDLEVAPGAFVLTAGRLWDDGKDVATLDRMADAIALPVLAAGPTRGPNGAEIALRHMHPLGNLSGLDIAAQLARRPIFASPARYEPFGLAVLEAAQAGCPLVLSDIPTFRELWNGAAVFVPVGDVPAWTATVEGLSGDPARMNALGRAARERAGRYGVDAMVDGTRALYRSVLPGQAAAA